MWQASKTYLALTFVLLSQAGAVFGETPAVFERAPSTPARELQLGDTLPDVVLRNQGGEVIHLRQFRGKATAVTFFYSRCPLPTFCPLVRQNFDATQALLIKLGVSEQCHLLSISLDPEHDGPEVLDAYAKSAHAEARLWTFAAGREEEIVRFGQSLGLEYRRTGERIDHNLRTVVIDAAGRLRHIFRGDGWTPQELAVALRNAARIQ